MLGNKRALLSVAVQGKPPENYILTEGQREGDVEIVQIDEKSGVVKIKNQNVDQTLDFKTDGAKTQPMANPVPMPGMVPPLNPQAPGNPGVIPPPRIPTRTLRLPGNPPPGPNSENPPQPQP